MSIIQRDDNWDKRFAYQERLGYDLASALEYNPVGFSTDDIVKVDVIEEGEHDGARWVWHVVLKDGRKYELIGGCDYTGWDCQSWLDASEIK